MTFLVLLFILGPLAFTRTSFDKQRRDMASGSPGCRTSRGDINRVMLVFGTRPEAVKMAPVIQEIAKHPTLQAITVSTGQHKEMLNQVLIDFNLQDAIDYELALMSHGQKLSELSARAIKEISAVISFECPDVVLVQGDTTTAFMAALAAFYAKIPVGHIEAGLRTHNIYAPFPEEVNRQSISTMATYHFAPTEMAALNLRAEGRTHNVYVTGNTVVDALEVMQRKPHSKTLIDLLRLVDSRAIQSPQKIILLTAHRRENLGSPLMSILSAISLLLKKHEGIIVVYPIHLNPEVVTAVKHQFGENIYKNLKATDDLSLDSTISHLNRLLLVPPMHHADLLALLQACHFVMTDSGGIQEEAITLGKPVLVLRDTTERPEGVMAGASKLVGTDATMILESADMLLSDENLFRQMSNSQQLFGAGDAAKQIIAVLQSPEGKLGLKQKFIRAEEKVKDPNTNYNLVVVLTVWKRNTIDDILHMIRKQSALKEGTIAVILFQNGEHVNVSSIVDKWKDKSMWVQSNVDLLHVFSKVETGYYGRFLGPFTVETTADAAFIILDDDIIFGNKYFENMLRVVKDGYLATRNGRFLASDSQEYDWRRSWMEGDVDTFNEDDEYDFGGHVWAGKLSWLRVAWQHPSPVLYNAEDFWISVVLQQKLGIGTKRPRCPKPDVNGDVELCSCSMKIANAHDAPRVGSESVDESQQTRHQAMVTIKEFFNYQTLLERNPDAEKQVAAGHAEVPLMNFSNLGQETTEKFAKCLFWY